MSVLFTTGWGALYLAVLLILMVPALFWHTKRYLALGMMLLFACDRAAVNTLEPEIALAFLAFAYMLVAVAVVLTHPGRAAIIASAALIFTSIAFIAGAFGWLDWDTTASAQELLGLIAMISIIFRKTGGGHAASGTGRARDSRRDLAGGLAPQRHHRK